ncbi:MAG: NirD/YgiW/YdeI family stress tolerance protein [Chitinispirillia bacterium]|nr:NirD/YgiW/YdeI family stress tolerance protein [Chitinispirillia bacterium]MCL2242361.1 NirD/YgiW/YdeI family stress tolerance protein [Chitinispirillia bacterium]
MKKQIVTLLLGGILLAGVAVAFAQGGFTGPGQQGGAKSVSDFDFGKIHAVTVEAAKKLPDDALVSLQGSIINALGNEKYSFRDSTGEIVVEIDKKVWRGISVGDKDKVEIVGEIDLERRGIEIDVKSIKKI